MKNNYKNEKEALHWLMSEIWELSNKPRRFFATLTEIVEQFYDDKKHNYCLDEYGKEEILLLIEKAQKRFYRESAAEVQKKLDLIDRKREEQDGREDSNIQAKN